MISYFYILYQAMNYKKDLQAFININIENGTIQAISDLKNSAIKSQFITNYLTYYEQQFGTKANRSSVIRTLKTIIDEKALKIEIIESDKLAQSFVNLQTLQKYIYSSIENKTIRSINDFKSGEIRYRFITEYLAYFNKKYAMELNRNNVIKMLKEIINQHFIFHYIDESIKNKSIESIKSLTDINIKQHFIVDYLCYFERQFDSKPDRNSVEYILNIIISKNLFDVPPLECNSLRYVGLSSEYDDLSEEPAELNKHAYSQPTIDSLIQTIQKYQISELKIVIEAEDNIKVTIEKK